MRVDQHPVVETRRRWRERRGPGPEAFLCRSSRGPRTKSLTGRAPGYVSLATAVGYWSLQPPGTRCQELKEATGPSTYFRMSNGNHTAT